MYSQLTVANGQIRLAPGIICNIKAYIQWGRDVIRVGEVPATGGFNVNDARNLLRKYKTHEIFASKSKTITETSKPPQFTSTTKWDEWCPVFINFLQMIPGRNGQPLSNVCRRDDALLTVPNVEFMDDYVNRAPLSGEAFIIDATEVHIYIQSFISGNEMAEAKILPHASEINGRLDFITLKEHYKGVDANSKELIFADKTLETLLYTGEKPPHMWWEEFEKLLTKSFTIYERYEGRHVYSNLHKIHILICKVDADFLKSIKTTINLELTRDPVTITYDQALTTFRNEEPQVSSSVQK